jgi:hypothetical protein
MKPTQGHIDALNQSQSVSGPPNRSNPFCTRFVRPGAIAFRFDSSLGRSDGGEAAAMIVQELVHRRWGLVVGEHGSGKSTLIETLLPRLHDRFCDVRTFQMHAPTADNLPSRWAQRRKSSAALIRVAKSLAPSGLMVVDGIEQLSLASRFRLIHIARSNQQFVLATSHRDLWPFSTLFRTRVTADLINNLTESLLADAPAVLRRAVHRELQTRPLTTLQNVRELWFDLYDVAETLPAAQDEPVVAHRK